MRVACVLLAVKIKITNTILTQCVRESEGEIDVLKRMDELKRSAYV